MARNVPVPAAIGTSGDRPGAAAARATACRAGCRRAGCRGRAAATGSGLTSLPTGAIFPSTENPQLSSVAAVLSSVSGVACRMVTTSVWC
jgi:hypothetical protein